MDERGGYRASHNTLHKRRLPLHTTHYTLHTTLQATGGGVWYFIVKYLCLGEPQVDKHKPEESHAAEQNKRVCAVGCWELEREEHVCVVCGCVGVWVWGCGDGCRVSIVTRARIRVGNGRYTYGGNRRQSLVHY